MSPKDEALFDRRPVRTSTCPRCDGCGRVVKAYSLMPHEHLEGAPADALCASVVGSFDIFTACREAGELADRTGRPVAFDFNDHLVVVRAGDDPDRVARSWWQRAYGESPEATFARGR